ncbi:MAG: RnfABCDGE type electron transport complex subunit D [Patescibacteria group bacterium]|jgi:Na+-translocating ferredoxin:NAD+ oxidoreductase RnfD subunit
MPKLNVKQLTILLILLLAVSSVWRLGTEAILWQLLLAASTAAVLEAAVGYRRTRRLALSESGLITGLIIAGVAAPGSSMFAVVLMTAIAIVSKHLLKIQRRNIFNPAAFGLLCGVLFLGVRLSWWIDASHLLTIVAGSVLLAFFTGRWRQILAFLAVFIGLLGARSWFSGQPFTMELYLYVSISSFFVFFMLTDPRTSPLAPRGQLLFAAVAAIGSFLSILFQPATIFIGGLLAANLLAAGLNWRALRPAPVPAAATPKPAPEPQLSSPSLQA